MLTRNRKFAILAMMTLIALSACDIRIDFGFSDEPREKPAQTQAAAAAPTPMPPTAEPAATVPAPSIPDGWLTYRSDANGFEIAYPPAYQALDDAESLYGWPNGVLLLYNQGQSYDIAIQVWDSVADYESALASQMARVTVFPTGSSFITVFNVTEEPENAAVIATFKLLD